MTGHNSCGSASTGRAAIPMEQGRDSQDGQICCAQPQLSPVLSWIQRGKKKIQTHRVSLPFIPAKHLQHQVCLVDSTRPRCLAVSPAWDLHPPV